MTAEHIDLVEAEERMDKAMAELMDIRINTITPELAEKIRAAGKAWEQYEKVVTALISHK